MKLVVAVSGGVDSMVLLDMLIKSGTHTLVVAHFDHGIRDDSKEDAALVGAVAKKNGLKYEEAREELGPSASEELARSRRYAFLRRIASKHGATVATAHHMDDIAETVAINLTRGTGWRGLAVMASDIYRPLLAMSKEEIYQYAKDNQLVWREDSTNQSDNYLRNRLRKKRISSDTTRQLAALRSRQVELRGEVEREISQLALTSPYDRYMFTMSPDPIAHELLRHVTRGRLTRPQQARALLAIKTQRPTSRYEAGAKVSLYFTTRHFTVQMVK